jgi:hypothetical protein
LNRFFREDSLSAPPFLARAVSFAAAAGIEGRNTAKADFLRFRILDRGSKWPAFQIFMVRVESGWLYELNGRWLEADDPRVIAERLVTPSCKAGV